MPIGSVGPSATPNAGRVIWNDNDADLQSQISTDVAALNTHKTSDDHDGRYYTEGEVDAIQVALEADIANTQQLGVDFLIKKATPALNLEHSDGSDLATLEASYSPETELRLKAAISGVLTTIMDFLELNDYIDFKKDVKVNGSALATEDYVTARLRTHSLALNGQTSSLSLGGAGGYTQANGTDQIIALLPGASATWVQVVAASGTKKIFGGAVSVSGEWAVKVFVTPSSGAGTTASVEIRSTAGATLATVTGGQGAYGVFAVSVMT